jgi:hypothetical protein
MTRVIRSSIHVLSFVFRKFDNLISEALTVFVPFERYKGYSKRRTWTQSITNSNNESING